MGFDFVINVCIWVFIGSGLELFVCLFIVCCIKVVMLLLRRVEEIVLRLGGMVNGVWDGLKVGYVSEVCLW